MKAIINNENKAKFFALYYDQCVLFQASFVKGIDLASICSGNDQTRFGEPTYLTLKPLSSISDEDAIGVANLVYDFPAHKLSSPQKQLENIEEIKRVCDRFALMANVSDFLRSRGYALPWMGLSVEELVSAGWIKLTES